MVISMYASINVYHSLIASLTNLLVCIRENNMKESFVTVVYDFVVYLSGGIWKLGKALKAMEFTLWCIFSFTG